MSYLDWHYFEMWPKIILIWRNLTLFPFYYFGVPHHLKTLLSPWKRQVFITKIGFHLEDFFSVIIINIFSRIIGAALRLCTVICSLILMVAFAILGLIATVVWVIIPVLTLPLFLKRNIAPDSHAKTLLEESGKNLSRLMLLLLKDKEGIFVMKHLGFDWQNLYIYFINQKEAGDFVSYLQIIDKKKNSLRLSDLFYTLSTVYPPLYDFLSNNNLECGDIYETALWYENLQQTIQPPLILDLARMKKTPGIGSFWAYGYTVELDKYTTDLTQKTVAFPILFGREKEIGKLENILIKSTSNNALLVGEPGTARRRIVETLAHRIQTGNSHTALTYKRLLYLDMHAIIAARPSLAEVKGYLSDILYEAESAGNIILVIMEIDKYLTSQENGMDLSDVFAKYAESPVALIGITTSDAFHRCIEKNPVLAPLFEKVDIDQPDLPTVLKELEISIAPVLEKKYNITITYQALKKTVEDAHKFISSTPFPAKAIDLLDECSVFLSSMKKESILTAAHITEFLSEKYHVSLGDIQKTEREKLTNLEKLFHLRLINQESAVTAISSAIRRARLEIANPKKPIGSFIFLGPTGVGKTETAKVLSIVYFGSEEAMIRFDMSQYQKEEGLERLIGSLKLGTPGELTSRLTDNPFSVLLFDEFEKSDKSIYNLFLTLIDEGYINDAFGKKVSAKNTIIIATSNAGAEYIRESINSGTAPDKLREGLIEYIQRQGIFSPELINRFDATIVFSPLSEGQLREVAKLMLDDLNRRLAPKNISIAVTPDLIKKLTNIGFDPQFGARAIQRVINDTIEDQIAKKLLSGNVKRGEVVEIEI